MTPSPASRPRSTTPAPRGRESCAYFLGRVHEELMGLDAAMKADPKGPGRSPSPWHGSRISGRLSGSDASTKNLETHRTGADRVRDQVNAWMQDHPNDYR